MTGDPPINFRLTQDERDQVCKFISYAYFNWQSDVESRNITPSEFKTITREKNRLEKLFQCDVEKKY